MAEQNYHAWNISPVPTLRNLSQTEAINCLLSWAILAPSPHNKQGWKVVSDRDEQSLTVWPEKKDIGSISDKYGRQTYLGVGCFLQTLSYALEAYSLPTDSVFVQDSSFVGQTISFPDLKKGSLSSKNWLTEIASRRAYRGKFKSGAKLPKEFVNLINSFLSEKDQKTTKIHLIEDQPTKLFLAEAQAAADRFVIMSEPFRKDLGHHLVPNNTRLSRVMPGNTFGLSDESAEKVHAALSLSGQFDGDFAAGFANLDRDGIVSASALGTICISNDNPESWINAGKLFQKIWLAAERFGLGLSVMGAMVESDIHNLVLKARLAEGKKPVVVFRLGFPLESYPHSPRITVAELF